MDVSAIAATATAVAQGTTVDAVQVAVLKKAMKAEAETAQQLMQAVPQPASNPPHLGNKVDTYA